MSLADALIERAAEAGDNHVAGWLSVGIVKARTAIEQQQTVAAVDATGTPEERAAASLHMKGLDLATDAVNEIEASQGALATFGRAKFAAVMIQLASGKSDEAELLMLAQGSTFAERRRASAASTEQEAMATIAREKATKETLDMIERVGLHALQMALPFILAAL